MTLLQKENELQCISDMELLLGNSFRLYKFCHPDALLQGLLYINNEHCFLSPLFHLSSNSYPTFKLSVCSLIIVLYTSLYLITFTKYFLLN